MIIHFILFAVGLYVFMRLISVGLALMPAKNRYQKIIKSLFPVVELVAWLIFIIAATIGLLEKEYYTDIALLIIFILLVYLLSRFVLKDLIAGVIIKTANRPEKDNHIIIGEVQGVISNVGYLGIELRNEKGQLVSIPYSRLSDSTITWPENEKNIFYRHSFELRVSKKDHYSEYIDKIQKDLLNNPWICPSQEPTVSFLKSEEDFYFLNVEVCSLSEKHAQKAEMLVSKELSINE